MYRQGDVYIIPVTEDNAPELEKDTVPRDRGRVVLAYGEATGHAHAIHNPTAQYFPIVGKPKEDDDRLLKIVQTSDLVHEEHSTVAIPPGLYIVRRQREYHPEEIRTVAD